MDPQYAERLYRKAMFIQEGQTPGLWLRIIQRLAHSGHVHAMNELAAWLSRSCLANDLGHPSIGHSAAGIYRRAWRKGEANAAQNLALSYFNTNDLSRYRLWLRRAARLGDGNCAAELKRFEIRLPHEAARRIPRQRPWAKRDW